VSIDVDERDDLGAPLDEGAPAPEPVADGSVWAIARASHAELARRRQARRPLELSVDGDDDREDTGIVVRFKWVPLSAMEKSTKGLAQIRAQTEQALFAAIDTLHVACDELLVRLPDNGVTLPDGRVVSGLTPLAGPGEPPVRFDHRLCDGMGWPRDGMTARKIVHKLYGGVEGQYAILEAALEVTKWIRGTGEDAAEDFAGG
jgi:hypothetical protein